MTEQTYQKMKSMGYIIDRQGKDFVTYKGLLWYTSQIGTLTDLHVEQHEIDWTNGRFMMKAVATLKTKSGEIIKRSSIGDATLKNVSGMIAPHALRMAATRAKARALRDVCMIGLTAIEEI